MNTGAKANRRTRTRSKESWPRGRPLNTGIKVDKTGDAGRSAKSDGRCAGYMESAHTKYDPA